LRSRTAGLLCWCVAATVGCAGSAPWSAERSPAYDPDHLGDFVPPEAANGQAPQRQSRSIGSDRPEDPSRHPEVVSERIALARTQGSVLGEFRNTYYDFPSEADFSGEQTPVFDAQCRAIASVPTAFHDTLCVQGSGLLDSGSPISFARRDCSCARVCPKTQQRICFEALDRTMFPWGRGSTGKAIMPLLTVAVDSELIPLETPLYIPEYEGLPRDLNARTVHDGCFVAQDRGLLVKGKHVDIFTGEPALTRLWNRLMPSNRGVTVVLDSPKCARAN
jgi:3D (Asp-Asp-Asp) domain-containing protein